MNGIGNKIKGLRQKRGLTQSEVAEIAGISRVAYTNIENDKVQSIFIEVGKGIAKALEIPFTELFEIDSVAADIEKLKIHIGRLKQNAVTSVDMYISNSISLKDLTYDRDNEDQKKEYKKYKDTLMGCKEGIFNTFISLGVCSMDELSGILNATRSGKI
jgi:transcriptional regulator with XRE-family HTH domain